MGRLLEAQGATLAANGAKLSQNGVKLGQNKQNYAKIYYNMPKRPKFKPE